MRSWLILVWAAVLAVPATAATDIRANPAKAWKHEPTGTHLPPTLAGLKRTKVAYFTAPEVDVAGDYWSEDGADTITVYLFRNVSGDVPVWFDRARYYIMNLPHKYGAVRPTGIRSFTPRGHVVTSGLIETFETSTDHRSTALAILPFGDFYAKVRVSSKVRDLAGIESLLIEALNSFDWSTASTKHPAAPVRDCEAPLATRGPAELIDDSEDGRIKAGLLGGLLAHLASSEVKAKIQPPERVPVFCREPGESSHSYGLYRADGDPHHYLLAVHDGGRAITVGRNDLAALIGNQEHATDSEQAKPAHYTVAMVHLDKVETFGDFSSLPLPDQAVEMVEKSVPVSVAGTWGRKNKEIRIITK